MANVIQQSVEFEKVSPEELFDILTDSGKHSEFTRAQASVSRQAGDSFSAFNGMVSGRNLIVIPNKLLVQSWRGERVEGG